MADALIVIALLAFIVGWVTMWAFALAESDEKPEGAAVFAMLIVIFGPALWAGGLIGKVVDRD